MNDILMKELKKKANLELARRDFFHFCKIMMPTFYKDNRNYLVYMCNEMQDFYEGNDEVLIVNVPP